MRKIVSSSLVAVLAPLPFCAAHAAPGCDAVVSVTAIRLALASNQPQQAVRDVATESFGIDSAAQAFLTPLIDAAHAQHGDDPAALADAIARSLGGACTAFASHKGLAAPVVAPIAAAAPPSSASPGVPGIVSGDDLLEKLMQNAQRTSARGKEIPSEGAPEKDDAAGAGTEDAQGGEPLRRTMVADLTQSELRKNLINSYQTYETMKDQFEHKAAGVSKEQVDAAADALEQAEQNALLTLPNYGLYVGPAFVQDSEGGFAPRAEFYAKFDSGRLHYDICELMQSGRGKCSGDNEAIDGWLRGFFDIDYISKDTNEEGEAPAETPATLAADPLDVFGRDDGRIQVNAGVQWHPFEFVTDLVGFSAGVGLTAPQEDGDDSREEGVRRGRTRWFAGLHSQTTYRFGIGEVFLGVAKDQYYDVRCSTDNVPVGCGDFSQRYLAEGTFALANDKATDWSLVGKVSADFPRDHDGESDVTVSVLLRKDLDGFLSSFGDD
jgi:hypothetical protein